jgi:DNA-directed RNA polymerase subunit RPC12/RpoP
MLVEYGFEENGQSTYKCEECDRIYSEYEALSSEEICSDCSIRPPVKREPIALIQRATVAAMIFDLCHWGVSHPTALMNSMTPYQITKLWWKYVQRVHPFGYVAGDAFQPGYTDPLGRTKLAFEIDEEDRL